MIRTLTTLAAGFALTAVSALANAGMFNSIIGDAANIERDAAAISQDLKPKAFDSTKLKADIDSLGQDIAALKSDVESIDKTAPSMNAQQKADWEMVKTKVELLNIFHSRKADLFNSDMNKNRKLVRALADGIAKRARMLQQTASRLDR